MTFQGCQTDGLLPADDPPGQLSIPAGKLSTGSDPAPARTAMVSRLPAAGAPRESADGAPLRLLPTVP